MERTNRRRRNAPPNPRSAYASSKLLGEWFAAEVPAHYILRVESLFGGPTAKSSVDKMLQTIRNGGEVRAFVDRTVSPSFVDDVVVATSSLLDRKSPPGVYHCVNSGWTTWSGIARELARMVLPLNTYTQWYWKVDLHNLLHFLRLRHDSHAQYEIRAYAEVLLDIARKWVPLTTAAFEEYRVGGAELSATALQVIRRRLAGEAVTRETSSLSQGEWRELVTLLPGLES